MAKGHFWKTFSLIWLTADLMKLEESIFTLVGLDSWLSLSPSIKNKFCMVLYSEWARLFLIVTGFLFGLLWGFWSLMLNKRMVIWASTRVWRLFGKIWYNDYHKDIELRWRPFVIYLFDEYSNIVVLWWLWNLEVKTLSGIFKPLLSGLKEQYKYCYI